MFLRKFCKQGPNYKRKLHFFVEFSSKESDRNTPPSKGKGLRDELHSMRIVQNTNLI